MRLQGEKIMDSQEKAKRVKDSINSALLRRMHKAKEYPVRQTADGTIDITPPKPDPEKSIEALMAERINNRINPETGMPFFSNPEDDLQEDPRDVQMRQIRMEMLKEAAKTGKVPEYLKNK